MPVIDIDSILAPLAPDDACGPNLEYDPAFAELDRLAQGKPEQQIGATLVPAEEPDWKAVQRAALALLARSKDLRAASHLTKALLRTAGWPGFAAGLATLRGLVEQYWEGLHPRLDPDDGNDPTMRVNVLAGLADGALLSAVRTATLVSSRTMGRFSLRDVEIASGEVPAAADVSPPGLATVDAAVTDCDLATLEETTAAARSCVEALAGLEAALGDRLSASATPSLGRLTALVRKAAVFLGTGLARRVPSAAAGGPGGVGGPADSSGNPAGSSGVSAGGGISSRDDVLRALDRICAYYARYEPSSPIPMFMERSKRLVTMTFVDIVKELVPDALTQVEVLRGRDN
jgi:type VI secretion system protein ImpA